VPPPARRIAAAIAGPSLIVVSVLVVLHAYAFSDMVSTENPDVLALWLPTHCYLGSSLASGHIPAWNPYELGGAPFAADPQSGWMYLPVMLLYTALSCGTALRWFIVLQPILGGLGIYAFARSEGLSRPAATTGGLALALGVAGSGVVLSIPFSATMAWTAVLLAAGSRLMRAETTPSRLSWAVVTAAAWGQLAAAHLSSGLVLGTMALIAFLAARVVADLRAGTRTGRRLLRTIGLLVVALPAVNLAYLLPRLAYLPRTSLGLGYERLQVLSRAYSGGLPPVGHLPGGADLVTTPLRMVASPGLYLGATAFALSFAGWRSRYRILAVAMAAFGAVSYVLSLDATADALAPHIRHWPLADFYLREPSRFLFGLPVAIAVLAAVGVDAWRDARSWRERLGLVAPAIAVWVVLPLAFNADLGDLRLFAVAALIAAPVLLIVARRPSLLFLVPIALAGELVASGLAGHAASPHQDTVAPGEVKQLEPLYAATRPNVRLADYLRPGPIARALQRFGAGRFITIDPQRWDNKGLHVRQQRSMWPRMATQRSMLFGLEEAQGYNATPELWTWILSRAVDPRRIKYNASYLKHPVPLYLDLYDVGWIVSPTDDPPDVDGAAATVEEGAYTLYRIPRSGRVWMAERWHRVQTGTRALHDVLRFPDRSGRTVVVQGGAGAMANGGGTAHVVSSAPQEMVVRTESNADDVLLIRTTFDPNWHGFVDGRPTEVLRADYALQGVEVPSGRHLVTLRYDDPTIGYGLLGSSLALSALLGPALFLVLRGRRRGGRRPPVGQSTADAAADRDPRDKNGAGHGDEAP
jgi:hypothetical protein